MSVISTAQYIFGHHNTIMIIIIIHSTLQKTFYFADHVIDAEILQF